VRAAPLSFPPSCPLLPLTVGGRISRHFSRFEAEWAEQTALASASTCAAENVRTLTLEWLKQLGARAPKWAARWTYAHLTLDIHCTQRAKAIHSAL
jgi:hypothetical protein